MRAPFRALPEVQGQTIADLPECSESALRKVLFPAGVVFKGSGFYVTDSREPRSKVSASANGSKDRKKDAGASGGKAAADAGSSSDGKAAAKSGTKQDS